MNLNKDVSSWARVSPSAAFGGSRAQAENVLKMAIEDIGRQDREIVRLRTAFRVNMLRYGATDAQIDEVLNAK